MAKSSKVRDPSLAQSGGITDLPASTVRKVVTPYVLKRDKEACKHIVERLKADQIAEEYR